MERKHAAVKQCLAVATCLLGIGCSGADEPEPETRGEARAVAPAGRSPDIIILISIDTLRADHLGVYGHERFTSPVLDGFAAEGVVFEDASATAPWTLPSHASILTGLFPMAHGVTSFQSALPKGIPTLATLLGERGYRTAAVINTTWLKNDKFRITKDFEQYRSIQDSDYHRKTPTRWVTDQAMEWLSELDLDAAAGPNRERLFLFMHYYDVHSDYASMPQWERLFVTPYEGVADGTRWQLQVVNFADEHIALCHDEFDPAICKYGNSEKPWLIDDSIRPMEFEEPDVRRLEELYDAGIRQLDSELGRFLAFLEERGLAERALVVVTSDHGEEFLEHGRVDHFLTTYQEVLRVPLLIRGPGIPRGMRIDAPVSSVDIAPTLLGLAGGGIPDSLEGLDLAPLWANRADSRDAFERRFLYGEAAGGIQYGEKLAAFYPVYRSIRQGRYKLVSESLGGGDALYDLSDDPLEQVDIIAEQPEIAEALITEMKRRHAGKRSDETPVDPVVLDPEEIDALRALGYLVP